MTTNSDDLEEALQQNMKLGRELGSEVAKARQGHLNSPRCSSMSDCALSGKADKLDIGERIRARAMRLLTTGRD
jgi:hypothetical protein